MISIQFRSVAVSAASGCMRSSFFSCRRASSSAVFGIFAASIFSRNCAISSAELISFAEFALNRFQLLAQVKLSLRTIDIRAGLRVDFLLDGQNFDLFVQQIVDASQARSGVGNVQYGLCVFDFQFEIRSGQDLPAVRHHRGSR